MLLESTNLAAIVLATHCPRVIAAHKNKPACLFFSCIGWFANRVAAASGTRVRYGDGKLGGEE